MTIHKTARFQVKPESLAVCQDAVREFIAYVQAHEPNQRVEFKTVSGTFPVHIERWVEPTSDDTVVHALIRGEAGGIFKLAAPLLDRLTRRQIEGDYQRL